MNYENPCPRCHGRGQINGDFDDPDLILSCPDCEGTGEDEDYDEGGEDTPVSASDGDGERS